MTDEQDIFDGKDPFVILRRWLDEATETELNDPNAMTLATVDESGLPNARIVLLKGLEADGLVFYTNYESQKGQELVKSGSAALLFHWKSLRRQIRCRGAVTKEDGPIADKYYATRPLQSRIGAWASDQSRPLESRDALMKKVETFTAELGQNPSRPPYWGGFRLRPVEFEFWSDGAYRLHDRFRWTWSAESRKWTTMRLSP